MQKKSHIYDKRWAHLRISLWHLLMHLKNKYLLKKTVENLRNKKIKQ